MGANFIFTSAKSGLTAKGIRGRLATNSANKTGLEVQVPEQDEPVQVNTLQVDANVSLDPILKEFEKDSLLAKIKNGEYTGGIRDTRKKNGDPKEWDYGWLAIDNSDLANVDSDDIRAALLEYAGTGKGGKGERLGIVGDWHEDTDYLHVLVATNRNYIDDGVVRSMDMSNSSVIAEEMKRLSDIIETKTNGNLSLNSHIYSEAQDVQKALKGISAQQATEEATKDIKETAANAIVEDAKESGTTPDLLAIQREIKSDERELAKIAERIAAKKHAESVIVENNNLTAANGKLEQQLKEQKEAKAKADEKLESYVETITALEFESQAYKESQAVLEASEVKLSGELTSTTAELNDARDSLKELSDEYKEIQSDLHSQEEATAKAEAEALAATKANESLSEQLKALRDEHTQLKAGIETERSMFNNVIDGYKAQVEALQQQVQQIKEDFELKVQQAVDAVASKKDSIIDKIQNKLEALKSEKDVVDERLKVVESIPNIDELLAKQQAAILAKEKENIVKPAKAEAPKMTRAERAKAKSKAVQEKVEKQAKGDSVNDSDKDRSDDLER